MQVLRLLAARRRAVPSTITFTAARSEVPDNSSEAAAEEEDDEGPFFDLDFSSSSSVRASSSSTSSSGSDQSSDDACSDLDFIISLHRSRSASPSYYYHETTALFPPPPPLQLCASIPTSNKKAPRSFYGGRRSFASSGRSLGLFMEESLAEEDDDVIDAAERGKRGAPSGDVIRRYFAKISRRLRSVRGTRRGDTRSGMTTRRRRLRKSRSASAAVARLAPSPTTTTSRRDDSLVEKQDGIASAIAHCKESFHRALSECDSSLLRSWSDPGKCQASS